MSTHILLLVSICVICLTTSALSNGDYEEGDTLGARLIHNTTYEKEGKDFKKRSKEIKVKAPKDEMIQAIVVTDLEGGGQSRVKRGGVGTKKVSLKLKSSRGRKLRFSVAVYAL